MSLPTLTVRMRHLQLAPVMFWPSVQVLYLTELQTKRPLPASMVFMLHVQPVAAMSSFCLQIPPFESGLVSSFSSRPQKPFSIGFNGATQLHLVAAMLSPSTHAAPGLGG